MNPPLPHIHIYTDKIVKVTNKQTWQTPNVKMPKLYKYL